MKRGFTLIELLVVIAIIGVLSAVVLVSLNVARTNGSRAAAKATTAGIDRALGDSAVSGWDFDECSGTTAVNRDAGAAMTLVNGPTWSTETATGKGCSLSFNGTNQYASGGNYGALSTNFTVAVWVYKSVPFTAAANWTILGKRNNLVAGYQIEAVPTGQVLWRSLGSGTQNGITSTEAMQTGKWYHLMVVHRNLSATIYINGKRDSTNTMLVNPGVDSTAFTIAYVGIGSGGSSWDGLIDGVRIYDAILSDADAARVYAQEVANHPEFATSVHETSTH